MRVAIAGAGVAGLAAAIALARRGLSVDLFERAGRLEEIGAGIQLSPNAMAVLERLGLLDDLAGGLVEPQAIEIRDAPSGGLLATIPLGETARRRWGSPYCLIHRADLQAVLLAAARREQCIAIALHAEAHDVRATAGGVVFAAGGRGRLADVLVAADGVHSRIRTGYFGHAGAAPLGATAWRATLPTAAVPDAIRRDATVLWLARGAHLVHYPVRGGADLNVVVIATAPAAPSPPQAPFDALFRRLLVAAPDWKPWPLVSVDAAPPWASGRVVLIGDAAHAMAPSAAQGGAQAIEDAWELAAALAADASNPVRALLAYERVRRARVERVVREARRNLTIYGLAGFPALARNALLKGLPAELLLSRLDWLFGSRPK